MFDSCGCFVKYYCKKIYFVCMWYILKHTNQVQCTWSSLCVQRNVSFFNVSQLWIIYIVWQLVVLILKMRVNILYCGDIYFVPPRQETMQSLGECKDNRYSVLLYISYMLFLWNVYFVLQMFFMLRFKNSHLLSNYKLLNFDS